MVFIEKDYDSVLRNLGTEYLISRIEYVPDIREWTHQNSIDLSEPGQPMKLISRGDFLVMVIQYSIQDSLLDGIINGLSVRWSLKNNVNNPADKLNTHEKRLVYCFLKEYIRSRLDDELQQDEWVINEMKKLEYFT